MTERAYHTSEDYYAAIRRLGLIRETETMFRTPVGGVQRVPLPGGQTPEQRWETVLIIKKSLGITTED